MNLYVDVRNKRLSSCSPKYEAAEASIAFRPSRVERLREIVHNEEEERKMMKSVNMARIGFARIDLFEWPEDRLVFGRWNACPIVPGQVSKFAKAMKRVINRHLPANAIPVIVKRNQLAEGLQLPEAEESMDSQALPLLTPSSVKGALSAAGGQHRKLALERTYEEHESAITKLGEKLAKLTKAKDGSVRVLTEAQEETKKSIKEEISTLRLTLTDFGSWIIALFDEGTPSLLRW